MQSDSNIIRSVAKGDKQAFKMLYNRYSEKVYNTALSYTKNVEDAEEITQDVFVKIFNAASSFKGMSSLNTWIYRIVVNTSLNYIKKKNRLTLFKLDSDDVEGIDFEHPGAILENKENTSAFFEAMDCLVESQKTAFILSYIEDLPRKEAASIMEISLKAVESLLQRAKKNMRVELEKIYPNRRKTNK